MFNRDVSVKEYRGTRNFAEINAVIKTGKQFFFVHQNWRIVKKKKKKTREQFFYLIWSELKWQFVAPLFRDEQ